jgi:hypothetical protein
MSVRLHPTKNKNLKLAGVPGIFPQCNLLAFFRNAGGISMICPSGMMPLVVENGSMTTAFIVTP